MISNRPQILPGFSQGAPTKSSRMARSSQLEESSREISPLVQDQAELSSSSPLFVAMGKKIFRLPKDGSSLSLGRTDGSAIRLDNRMVSRNHAELRAKNGVLEIRDLNSTNGTFVGEKRLEPGVWHAIGEDQKLSVAGASLTWSPSKKETPEITQSSGESTPKFSLKGANGAQIEILNPPKGNFTVGRSEDNLLQLDNGRVSRRHAEIKMTANGLLVQDLGSTNGTFIEGQKLKAGEWRLAESQDEIKIGVVPFTVESMANQAQQVAGAAIGGPVGVALTMAGLKSLASKTELESKPILMEALNEAKQSMSQNSGIVELPKGIPTMVIPDIHGQRDYLTRALEHEVDGTPVLDLLKQGKMNLLCLGDGMHGEGRAKDRWIQAQEDFLDKKPSQAMKDEMIESLGTMKMVMDLKRGLGENFAYLRGNHDDINPEHGYRKYTMVGESELVKNWVTENYGQDFLENWHGFEKSMPLIAKGSGFVASHAAPGGVLDRNEVESKSAKAFRALAWTENRNWEEQGQQRENFEANLKVVGAEEGDRWLVGHRKVEQGNVRTQFDEQLIQVNPLDRDGFVVAMIGADGSYEPKKDTFKI